MELDEESRIALDLKLSAPHPWLVRDDPTDPQQRRTPGKPASTAPAGKDAKLAAALRANLARRKVASRAAGVPAADLTQTDKDQSS